MKKKLKHCVAMTMIVCMFFSINVHGEESDNIVQETEQSAIQSQLMNDCYDSDTYLSEVQGPSHIGWHTDQEGNKFFYEQDGSLYLGWKYEDGKWYYLDGNNTDIIGIMVKDTVMKIGNQYYCFDAEGIMQSSGWISRSEGWYYADASGALITGWKDIRGTWYYFDGNNEQYPGLMVENCTKYIDGHQYYFNADGAMQFGWLHYPEGWYYTDTNGAQAIGWRYIHSTWYYFDGNNEQYPGLMVENCVKDIQGYKYYFSAGGAMKFGWLRYPEGWYYANTSGAQAIGWQRIGNAWYYFDGNNEQFPGLMVSNCTKEINGNTYIFNASGAMREGWYYDNGDWYYYDTSGFIASGWRVVKGYWYYLNPSDNKMLKDGWKKIDNNWYYFYSSGAMATNWLAVGGYWYFLSDNGAMKTGWQNVGGTWYYLYQKNDAHGGLEGVMARNCYIDGYYLSANGAMLSPEETRWVLRAQPYSSQTGYLILVDRAACRTTIFAGSAGAWNLLYNWQCAPGKPSTPTVGGQFTVGSKGYYFDSGNARCYWYTQFCGDYLFHSVLYSKYNGSLMDGRVGMQLSHGCVRLPIQNAKWIYDNIPTGTKVVVF